MYWTEILTALALVLVIEGMLPFVRPGRYKQLVAQIVRLSDNQLRTFESLGLFRHDPRKDVESHFQQLLRKTGLSEDEAKAEAERLESSYDDDLLERMVKAGGQAVAEGS